eukprot:12934243-Prorocentrum_lima.AAC.1
MSHLQECVEGGLKIEQTIVGFFMVYMDDAIMFGCTSTVKNIIDAFRKPGTCRVTGVIPRYGITIEEE